MTLTASRDSTSALSFVGCWLFLLLTCLQVTAADWPGVNYTEVRAYYYNLKNESGAPLVEKGILAPSVTNIEGALLNAKQEKRLLTVLNGWRYASNRPGCYTPRHGFVFFDAKKKIVAFYEVCLECHLQRGEPEGLAHVTDLPAIADLLEELKLPLSPLEQQPQTAQEYRDANFMFDPPAWFGPYVDEKTGQKAPPPPNDPDRPFRTLVGAISFNGSKVPAARFEPWLEADPSNYAGVYTRHPKHFLGVEGIDVSISPPTITVELTKQGTEWVCGATHRAEKIKVLEKDQPLQLEKFRFIGNRRGFPIVFVRFTEDNETQVLALRKHHELFVRVSPVVPPK